MTKLQDCSYTGVNNVKFLEDLSFLLISFLENHLKYNNDKIPVKIQNEEVYLTELFLSNGMLPIFVYNKNDIINEYLKKFNNQYHTDYKAEFIFIENNNSFVDMVVNFSCSFQNDSIVNDTSSLDFKVYIGLLDFLVEQILKNTNLSIKDGAIHLDKLYHQFYNYFYALNNIKNDKDNIKMPEVPDRFNEYPAILSDLDHTDQYILKQQTMSHTKKIDEVIELMNSLLTLDADDVSDDDL